ncbi:MAG TPA: FKBP-type peptidyl-prolyl cis-trans isomerase, partial [Geobacteraceae bacterium]|nr:FKBP-type peptidyl-prolyl cis-trans isomerase [Geobacteraceae bacterium]
AAPSFALQAPETEEQKTLYAIGLLVGRQLDIFSLSPADLEWVKEGLVDKVTGQKEKVELAAYNEKVQEFARAKRKLKGEKQAAAGKEYLEKAAAEKGAVKTESGLVYISLKEGEGESPKATDTVKVHYIGTLVDGKEFDSSYKRNKPIDFRLDGVIKCWTEGVQKMKPGGKAKLVCPSSIAYGENGAGEVILPGATLVFEVELLEIVKPAASPAPAPAPAKPQTGPK